MSEYVLFDEIRMVVRVPADLEGSACQAIQRILAGRPFRSALRRAIRHVVRPYLDLKPIRVHISR